MSDEKEVERAPNGQFPKGVSGNPAGRPKGSKNRVTLLKLMAEEAVREGHTEDMLAVANLVIQQALSGDQKSQKLVWDAIMSKGTSDDKSQAKERVEINIGGMAAEPVKIATVTQIDQEDEDDDEEAVD